TYTPFFNLNYFALAAKEHQRLLSIALRGAKIVFVDVRPDTMNIDETLIEAAITDKTRVIVPVHILVPVERAQAADILALFDERLRHDVMLRI
ncbi:DegT/DnrJ/EryC1/StrS family aminotransferase, partial [Escherichia coli]|nr:DegT/DnrJ/EryC1/StrS family aminotransferase [Escherichia coli]